MKITHNKVGQNLNVNDSARSEKSDKTAGKKSVEVPASILSNTKDPGAAKVQLSDRAQEMNRIKELAKAAPDIDEAKVARLQKQIDEGTYKVDAKSIADKMVDDHIEW